MFEVRQTHRPPDAETGSLFSLSVCFSVPFFNPFHLFPQLFFKGRGGDRRIRQKESPSSTFSLAHHFLLLVLSGGWRQRCAWQIWRCVKLSSPFHVDRASAPSRPSASSWQTTTTASLPEQGRRRRRKRGRKRGGGGKKRFKRVRIWKCQAFTIVDVGRKRDEEEEEGMEEGREGSKDKKNKKNSRNFQGDTVGTLDAFQDPDGLHHHSASRLAGADVRPFFPFPPSNSTTPKQTPKKKKKWTTGGRGDGNGGAAAGTRPSGASIVCAPHGLNFFSSQPHKKGIEEAKKKITP